MSLRETLMSAKVDAMKAKDRAALKVLRVLCSSIQNKEIETGAVLSDNQTIALVKTQVKQLKDALKDFLSAGREDLIVETQAEIDLLTVYLPKQMSKEQICAIIDEQYAALESPNMGQLMGAVMKAVAGQADGALVRELVAKKLA